MALERAQTRSIWSLAKKDDAFGVVTSPAAPDGKGGRIVTDDSSARRWRASPTARRNG
ncbi:hypothetical protein AB5I41_02805 [Sphingomonas sp. MMS24-JH45]